MAVLSPWPSKQPPRDRESRHSVLIALHKPYGVLSQFTPEPGSRWRTLAGFGFPKNVYPIGRLDADSEGLLLLTDETDLNARLLDPVHGHAREYWVQVERVPGAAALARLARGIVIGGHRTRSSRAWRIAAPPALPPRDPPIRIRRNIPDAWIALELTEGKNRQVRRMTAAVGHPTLRLVRVRIGAWMMPLDELSAGIWRELGRRERAAVLASGTGVGSQGQISES
jgi:23S rRNA pseudouridine2457 synthase